jgi:hypothetical protein
MTAATEITVIIHVKTVTTFEIIHGEATVITNVTTIVKIAAIQVEATATTSVIICAKLAIMIVGDPQTRRDRSQMIGSVKRNARSQSKSLSKRRFDNTYGSRY